MTLEWDSGLMEIADAFRRAGAEAYVVGGTVRNRLLGLPVGDLDIAGPLSPDEAMAALREIPGVKARIIHRELGTVGATVAGCTVEYTPFRTESYSQGHRPTDVRFGATLEQDALRRDFTINAIYAPLSGGQPIDPLGGIADLQARVLRAVRPSPEETLRDDGLRLLRLCRFAAELRFFVEPLTLQAAKAHCHIIDDIAAERIMAEITRILLADGHYDDVPIGGTAEGLRLMREIGLWKRLLPKLPEPNVTLYMAISALPPSLPTRLAALGYKAEEKALLSTLKALRFSGANIAKTCEIQMAAKHAWAFVPEQVAIDRTKFCDSALEEAWRLLVALGEMDDDTLNALHTEMKRLQEGKIPRAISDLVINGSHLLKMGYPSGPQLGQALAELLRRCAIGEVSNSKRSLSRMAIQLRSSYKKSLGGNSMWFKNGRALIDGSFQTGVDVRVENGKIAELGVCPDGAQAVDLQGKVLSPGLIDIHTHGFGGTDVMLGGNALDIMAAGIVKRGVTSFVATTATHTAEATQKALADGLKCDCFKPETSLSRCIGFHIEGPFLGVPYRGAHSEALLRDPTPELWQAFVGDFQPHVRIAAISPEREGAISAIERLSKAGITVSIAHTDASYEVSVAAADAGATEATHCFNGMRSLHHREPGPLGHVLTDSRITCEIIADGIHIHPAIIKIIYQCKGCDKAVLITDAMAAAGLGDGEYELGRLPVTVKNGVARIAAGNLAGSTLTLDVAVKNAVTLAGIPFEHALHMATAAAARQAKAENIGRIAVGFAADLVVWNDDLTVASVYRGGRSV